MKITLKNQTAGILSYIEGVITVAASSQTIVPDSYSVILLQDTTLISDFRSGKVFINDGLSDYNLNNGFQIFSSLNQFMYTPLTNVPLYYSSPVNVRQGSNTSAGATVWAMRNPLTSTKNVYIERIYLMSSFDNGTPLGRSLQRYDLVRFSSATPTNGSSISVVSMDSSAPATQVTDVRSVDTGLTTTGVSFGSPIATIGCPATDQTTNHFLREEIPIILAAGEGLCIRLTVSAVSGQGLTGEIVWSER